MKESYLFDMSFNNVVFTGRNKLYGAYELRKNYSKHITMALLIATTTFAGGLSWPLLGDQTVENTSKTATKELENKPLIIITGTDIMPPPKEQEAIPEPKIKTPNEAKIKTVANVQPKVVPDNHQGPETDVPTQDQLKGAIIGTTNQEGEETNLANLVGIETGSESTGTGTEDANEVFDFVADMPSFEGGEEGLMRYISRRIKYPRQAVTEQIEGIVVVSFVVNQYGKVTDATVVKGLGYGTDEEALRVINALPNWKPGKQNGSPVAVRYSLPIRFSMQR